MSWGIPEALPECATPLQDILGLWLCHDADFGLVLSRFNENVLKSTTGMFVLHLRVHVDFMDVKAGELTSLPTSCHGLLWPPLEHRGWPSAPPAGPSPAIAP